MISIINNYIIERFQADELVNTISLSALSLIDTKKENIYPLVSLEFLGKDPADELHLYTYTISILAQRNNTRKMKPSKLMEDENWVDNLNECDSIAVNFINYIRRMEIDLPINIESVSDMTPLSGYGGANLDGFEFEITFSLPNNGFCSI